ncbi:hypothetical protein BGZ63DRAFT_370411 [Mariannaea sp. PMI_226]|nr:hypothetical protein BGZ63DRAFT_370411 [Mariannaea sp. PMI_226]
MQEEEKKEKKKELAKEADKKLKAEIKEKMAKELGLNDTTEEEAKGKKEKEKRDGQGTCGCGQRVGVNEDELEKRDAGNGFGGIDRAKLKEQYIDERKDKNIEYEWNLKVWGWRQDNESDETEELSGDLGRGVGNDPKERLVFHIGDKGSQVDEPGTADLPRLGEPRRKKLNLEISKSEDDAGRIKIKTKSKNKEKYEGNYGDEIESKNGKKRLAAKEDILKKYQFKNDPRVQDEVAQVKKPSPEEVREQLAEKQQRKAEKLVKEKEFTLAKPDGLEMLREHHLEEIKRQKVAQEAQVARLTDSDTDLKSEDAEEIDFSVIEQSRYKYLNDNGLEHLDLEDIEAIKKHHEQKDRANELARFDQAKENQAAFKEYRIKLQKLNEHKKKLDELRAEKLRAEAAMQERQKLEADSQGLPQSPGPAEIRENDKEKLRGGNQRED